MKTITFTKDSSLNAADYYGGNRGIKLRENKNFLKESWKLVKPYRYLGAVSETHVFTREVRTEKNISKDIAPDEVPTVYLGGPFEQVGGDYETAGGDDTKMG